MNCTGSRAEQSVLASDGALVAETPRERQPRCEDAIRVLAVQTHERLSEVVVDPRPAKACAGGAQEAEGE